jgi:type II secretory pathway pseudopilin PulG
MNAILRKKNGFTIIETIVAVFVFTITVAAVGSSIIAIYRTQSYTVEQAVAIDEARRGVDIMANEIRRARYGDNGAYPIEKGAGKEFIFYSDIDADGLTERVRYYLATVSSGSQTKECFTATQGGACSATFDNFLQGTLKTARVQVSTEGYYGTSSRYSEFYADGTKLANICDTGCSQCAGAWQGTETFDMSSAAADNSVQFTMDSTNSVRRLCQWINPNHAMKVKFDLSWTEEIQNSGNELRKGVIKPVGIPPTYPADQEVSTIITTYVRNAPPIFTYYDANGDQIISDPSILRDTKMMRLFMVVNVNPARAPYDYDLEQYVQLRNLKE